MRDKVTGNVDDSVLGYAVRDTVRVHGNEEPDS